MTSEDLQLLKDARAIIAKLDASIGVSLDELPDAYADANQKLDEIIARWETTP